MDRFWARVVKSQTCWSWSGPPGNHGYGQAFHRGHVTLAHRVAYELTYGPIPDGLFVCHHCDVKLCVRPEHLFAGSHRANMDDLARKCRHPRRTLTTADVLVIRELLARRVPQRDIAARFGLSQRSVHNIVHGLTYRYDRLAS